MEDSTEIKPSTQWFVFFKDQLLLKKGYTEKGEIKYSVPVRHKSPLGTGKRKQYTRRIPAQR